MTEHKIQTGVNWIKRPRGRQSEGSEVGDNAAHYLEADSDWNLRRQ